MKICIINGSPRGINSNSSQIAKWMINGHDCFSQLYIKHNNDFSLHCKCLDTSDKVIVIFPLYTDSMPGIVMAYFEELKKNKNIIENKPFLFIIHSGFREGVHCEALKKYLSILSDKLKFYLIDVIICSGSESFRMRPTWTLKKEEKYFSQITNSFMNNEIIDKKIKKALMKPYKLNKFQQFSFKLFSKIGLNNLYWIHSLKKNNAYKNRFDKL